MPGLAIADGGGDVACVEGSVGSEVWRVTHTWAGGLQTGEAMSLGCQCRGEMALRHRACATKWSRVKGDGNCDICKAQVQTLSSPRTVH